MINDNWSDPESNPMQDIRDTIGDIERKAGYVKAAGQTRDHLCHWPGCEVQIPPAMWGCTPHWYKLPKEIRSEIWRTYEIGQEENGHPSPQYMSAARKAQDWIAEHGNNQTTR